MHIAKSIFLAEEASKILKFAETARGPKYARVFNRFVKIWNAEFNRQYEQVIAYIDNNPQMFVEIRKDAQDDFENDAEAALLEAFTIGMVAQEADIQQQLAVGLQIEIKNEDAVKWAQTRVGEMIKDVDITTQKEIQAIIASALTEGKSMADIKKEIFEKFQQYNSYRSSLIAVMEMGNSYEQGKKAQFAQYQDHFGVVGFKKSFAHHDSSTRQTHLDNEKAGWIRATALFPGTLTDTAPHGFNCRCNVQYSLYDQDEAKPEWM